MRKGVGLLLGLLVLLSSCGEKESCIAEVSIQDASILEQIWAAEEEDSRELQRNLARWYNVNLCSSDPDPDYQQAYEKILYYTDGLMGYVQLSSPDRYILIHHGEIGEGFSHDPYSAFPIGRRGDHTVLRCQENILLEQGDVVVLWVLGEPMTYVVGQTGTDTCTLQCGQMQYICGRVTEGQH